MPVEELFRVITIACLLLSVGVEQIAPVRAVTHGVFRFCGNKVLAVANLPATTERTVDGDQVSGDTAARVRQQSFLKQQCLLREQNGVEG